MTPLRDLLARCEASEGPDREIDHAICHQFGTFIPWVEDGRNWRTKIGEKWIDVERHGTLLQSGGNSSDRYVEKYTSSIDTAIALIERLLPGRRMQIRFGNDPPAAAEVWHHVESDYVGETALAATPALALVAALLKSLIAGEEKGNGNA